MKPAAWLSHQNGLLLHAPSSVNDIPLYPRSFFEDVGVTHNKTCYSAGPAHYKCCLNKLDALSALLEEDFCDKNCSWSDHHPDCVFSDG